MSNLSPSDVERQKINRWILNAKSLADQPVWTERRLAIDFGGHTYIVNNGQIFQCAHCGHFDPEWSASKVLSYFYDFFGIKPYEIDVVCTVAVVKDEK